MEELDIGGSGWDSSNTNDDAKSHNHHVDTVSNEIDPYDIHFGAAIEPKVLDLFQVLQSKDANITDVRLAIENCSNINMVNESGYTPLLVAAEKGWVAAVQLIIDAGADVNFQTKSLNSQHDQPSLIRSDGTKFWHKNGQLHRDGDKPAVEYPDGSKFWFQNGELHRDGDNPVIEYADGEKFWCKDGK